MNRLQTSPSNLALTQIVSLPVIGGLSFVMTFGLKDSGLLLGLIFCATALIVSVIDVRKRVIPNKLLTASALIGVLVLVVISPVLMMMHLLWACICGLILLIPAAISPKMLGMGDVKFSALIGLYLGNISLIALCTAMILTSIFGLGIIIKQGMNYGRKATIPFGPFLAAGGLLTMLIIH